MMLRLVALQSFGHGRPNQKPCPHKPGTGHPQHILVFRRLAPTRCSDMLPLMRNRQAQFPETSGHPSSHGYRNLGQTISTATKAIGFFAWAPLSGGPS